MGAVCTTITWRARPGLAAEAVGELSRGQGKRIKTVRGTPNRTQSETLGTGHRRLKGAES